MSDTGTMELWASDVFQMTQRVSQFHIYLRLYWGLGGGGRAT